MADDPELERRLEAMFASARPRRGFEDELWRRIQARRSLGQRLGGWLQPALRFAPAVAMLLIVALGVTWLAGNLGNLHFGGGSASSTYSGGPMFASEKAVAPVAFGVLPPLAPGTGRAATAPQATAGNADTNASNSFNGALPSLPSSVPVYRYDEPTAADRAKIGAALQAQSGLAAIAVTPSDAARGVEPQLVFSGPAPSGAQGGLAEMANAFLAGHNLTPRFPFGITLTGSGQVLYGRLFGTPRGAYSQVRPDGAVAGLTVEVSNGLVSGRGPLELPLAAASYPLRSAAEAIAAASAGRPPGAASFDRAELVYVLVVSGGHGYYEPELLLTGPNGVTLSPMLAPKWLGA